MVKMSESEIPPFRYTAEIAGEIEARWQAYWEEHGTFFAPNPVGELADPSHPRAGAPKLHVQDMFPYPSGAGLHVGHPLGYIGTDCYTRYKRMAGFNVLHPMGFDAFGLPAEQYAVQTGTHPATTTEANVERYRSQLRRLGLAYDARRSASDSCAQARPSGVSRSPASNCATRISIGLALASVGSNHELKTCRKIHCVQR